MMKKDFLRIKYLMERKRKKTILVVEDDSFLVKIYISKLTREGFEVVAAYNGEEGINKAKSQKPDLILLDLVLPKKDGFSVLEDLKKDQKLKKVPVLIMSNLGQESDIIKGKEMGAVDYLIKANASINEVVEKIKEYIT